MLNLSSSLILLFLYAGGCYFPSGETLVLPSDYLLSMTSLVEKLKNNSSIIKEILPVADANSSVKLDIKISLRQISALDEINQAIRLNVWLELFWNNPFLQWDTKDYGGIEAVHLNSESFWTPDIALLNKASLDEDIDILYKRLRTNVIINHDGNCTWTAPITLLAQCRIDVSRFPFDEQDCPVTLSSWTHRKHEIDITAKEDKADMDHFIQNGEWEVSSAILSTKTEYYDKVPYSQITMDLHIKRKSLYFRFNLIMPCALIALLSFASFLLPSENGERVSLVITVLLANSVYMLLVSSSLPHTSDSVPVIVAYFLGIIIEIALCLFATCFTLKICANDTEMPDWMETMVNKRLAWFMFLAPKATTMRGFENGTRDIVQNERFRRISERERYVKEKENGSDSSLQRDVEFVEIGLKCMKQGGSGREATSDQEVLESKLLAEIRHLVNEVRSKASREVFANKWRRAAKVLDRFFLSLFVFIYLIMTSYLLASN